MEVRIYYEDTDAAGVVYHANYIKYLERARTEFFRDRGLLVSKLAQEGFVFPVIRLEIDFTSPAVHDDLLIVDTTPVRVSGASVTFRQKIIRYADGKLLLEALVGLACVDSRLKARRLPAAVRTLLQSELAAHD